MRLARQYSQSKRGTRSRWGGLPPACGGCNSGGTAGSALVGARAFTPDAGCMAHCWPGLLTLSGHRLPRGIIKRALGSSGLASWGDGRRLARPDRHSPYGGPRMVICRSPRRDRRRDRGVPRSMGGTAGRLTFAMILVARHAGLYEPAHSLGRNWPVSQVFSHWNGPPVDRRRLAGEATAADRPSHSSSLPFHWAHGDYGLSEAL